MNQLDSQQRIAVETESQRVMVLAGAGSGKTRVLIERIAHLVEEKKVSSYEILTFTFTRKAAGEIKARLVERLGPKAYHITMGTMHALALEMVNRFGEIVGLKSKMVTIYGQWEEDFLLRDVAQEMGLLKGKTWRIPKKDVYYTFDQYYQRGVEPELYEPTHDLFQAFIQRCKENNALTYGGLLIGLRLLVPTLAQFLNVRHILVDEVQDIDHLQWEIILLMEKAFNASLFVVGDVDQSIYEWRGAAPKYLVDHQSEFDICRLETNYRSVGAIVEAANNLINNNRDRITKTMVVAREDYGECGFLRDMDSEHLVMLIEKDLNTEVLTVLARNHFLLEKLSRLLSEGGIVHNYVGKTTALTNSEEFRRFHAFLKLLVNPFDNFSFLLIKDLMGITQEEYLEIRAVAAEKGVSHYQAWEGDLGFLIIDGEIIDTTDTLFHCLGSMAAFAPTMAFISQYPGKDTIPDYLNWLALYEIQDEIKENDGGITLMTIHAAKGLEWPIVVLAGCNEGIIPSKHACDNDEIEAERRLMYVAMTRARDQLIFAVRPERTEKDGRVYESPRSRFLGEAL